MSNIDWEGKKISDSNSYYKSLTIARALEIKYGLDILKSKNIITNESINSIEARKYYLSNELAMGLKSDITSSYIKQNLNDEQMTDILKLYKTKDQLTNDECRILLGVKKAKELENYLGEHGVYKKLFKDELLKKIEEIYKKSKSTIEFLVKLNTNDIYVRKLFSNKNTPYFVYGIKDVSFYIKDKDLSKRFTYGNIYSDMNNGKKTSDEMKSFSIDEQKSFIKTVSNRVLRESKTLQDFSHKLNEKGIELITYENKGGIYGVAYKSIHISNPEIIKGSEMDLSWKTIEAQIRLNNQFIAKEITGENQFIKEAEVDKNHIPDIPYVPFHIPLPIQSQESEEDLNKDMKKKKKKKSKKTDNDLKHESGI
jgi:hypothetical protein